MRHGRARESIRDMKNVTTSIIKLHLSYSLFVCWFSLFHFTYWRNGRHQQIFSSFFLGAIKIERKRKRMQLIRVSRDSLGITKAEKSHALNKFTMYMAIKTYKKEG